MAEVPPLDKLYRQYQGQDIQFFTVYAREAHPGEHFPHHSSIEQKLAYAAELRRQEGMQVPILLDALDGAIHQAYGLLPNMIYVINKQGLIVYKADWTDCAEVADVLETLLRWEELKRTQVPFRLAYSERLSPVTEDAAIRKRVYERSGPKAIADFTRSRGRPPF